MFGKCVLSIRAFSIIGCSRERVVHKYHRRKEAAPTLLVARGVAGGPRRVPRLPANVPPVVTRCSLEGYALVARPPLHGGGGTARSTEREAHHEDGYRRRVRAAGFERQPHRLASPRHVRRGLQDA